MIALDLSAEEVTKFLKMRCGRASDHCFTDQLTVCFTLYRDTNRVIQVNRPRPPSSLRLRIGWSTAQPVAT
jgi:hypothetical protein